MRRRTSKPLELSNSAIEIGRVVNPMAMAGVIADYIADQTGLQQAERFLSRLDAEFARIPPYQPIAIKAHGRRAKSLFRYGCDFLRRICCDLAL